MKASITTFLTALLPLVSAHFSLNYPSARAGAHDTQGDFPCGGQNTVSPNRTLWPTKGGPIQLKMGHVKSAVQVYLGLGNDVGSNFNVTLVPIFQEQGLGEFCMSDVTMPSNLNIVDGQNATIQVVTNGDPTGGLYNCADITFSSGAAAPPACTNGTGVSAAPYTGSAKNANETGATSTASTSAASGSAPSTSSSPSSSHTAAAARAELASWAIVGGMMVGAVALI
ncbi:hypothetical protein MMC16_007835 [Acarospora aff. strigata]|nr:hypothetical protein [Acarospora aff. strigata]